MLDRLTAYPLFRLTLALATGIFVSGFFFSEITCVSELEIAWGCTFVIALACYPLKVYRWRMLFGIVVYVNVALLGAVLFLSEREAIRYAWVKKPVVYIGTIVDVPHHKPKTMQAVVQVECMKVDSAQCWQAVDRKIVLYWMPDSIQGVLSCGDRLVFRSRISRPVSDVELSGFDYGLYLERQGIAGTAVAFAGDWQKLKSHTRLSFRQRALLYREQIVRIFQSWGLEGEVLAVVSALTVGDKSELTQELKDSYTAAGTSHILALSGMHIVLLAFIVSWILYPLRYVRGGKWLLSILIVIFLWSFAFLSGLSPSVIRAVVMYTLCVVAAVFTESRFAGVSSVSLAAFLMLLYQPMYLFDVSFQLSFVAVLSLLVIYPLVERLLHSRWWVLNYLWQSLAISFAAQLGTLPFILCYFGTFPTYFLLANLVVTPLSVVILALTLICLVCGAISWLVKGLSLSVQVLNGIMEWVQGLSGSQITSVYFSPLQAWLLALCIVAALLYVSRRSARKLIAVLCCLDVLMVTFLVDRLAPTEDYLYFSRSGIYTKRERNVVQLFAKNGICQIKTLRVALANDARWKDKEVTERLPLDYIYICKGFKGDMEDLTALFQLRKVVFDNALNESYKKRLRDECESLGIACVDMTEKGSYAVLIK